MGTVPHRSRLRRLAPADRYFLVMSGSALLYGSLLVFSPRRLIAGSVFDVVYSYATPDVWGAVFVLAAVIPLRAVATDSQRARTVALVAIGFIAGLWGLGLAWPAIDALAHPQLRANAVAWVPWAAIAAVNFVFAAVPLNHPFYTDRHPRPRRRT